MRKLPTILTEQEVEKLISKVKLKHHKTAFALGFYQGMRISEVVNLKKEDVNLNTKMIHIKQAKGSKDRIIPISPKAIKYLRHIPIKCGIRALQMAFKTYSKKILNKDVHFHTLRHSGATHYHNNLGWDIRQVQQFLGHEKIQTTEIYTHINPQDLLELMYNPQKTKRRLKFYT